MLEYFSYLLCALLTIIVLATGGVTLMGLWIAFKYTKAVVKEYIDERAP
jgi:hypothetical protein